tara:strand:- start:54585 stop:55265 length:681 start_codon:yes stop_codon:yes gene_type:complete
MISLKQIDSDLKNVFSDTRVQLIDSVYELSKDEKYYKLVFSIHSLDVELEDTKNTIILHTKFIFRTNLSKSGIVENSFWYLKDINCKYSKVDFESNLDLVDRLNEIINENSFGEDIKMLSHFISEAPSSSINDFLHKNYTDEFTVTNVLYNPTLKMTPCKNISFDFDIDINNGESVIKLSVKKKETNYKFYYYINDDIEVIDSEFLGPLPQLIGDHLQYLYSKFLK